MHQRLFRCAMLAAALAVAPTLEAAVAGARPPGKPAKKYPIEQFFATKRITGGSFSADEKRILYSSDESGTFNVYAVPAAGGKAEQLTNSTKDSTFAVSFFPNDDRFLFTRDSGGNELNHLFVRELDGTERDLTPGDKLKAAFHGWHADGAAFYVTTNERDPRFFDLYRYDAKTYARTMLYKNDQGLDVAAISRDEKWVALNKSHTTIDSDIHLYDVAKGETRHLTPHSGSVKFSAQTFDPASQRLLFTSDEGSEFARIKAHDLATGQVSEFEKADWDIDSTYYSRDGRFRVTVVNEDGSTVVRVAEVAGGTEKPLALPKLPGGMILGVTFSRSGNRMAFRLNGDRAPSNLFSYDFKTRKLTQLTQSLSRDVDPVDLVDAEVVRFRSFDGMVIPSIFYKPHGASATRKVPAVVFVHGGPGGQTTRGYSSTMQYLANNGYAVLGINNRGSTGYGKTFFAADDKKHGREPLWDCIEARTYLASLGFIDHERIAIMGGSYGGYMTLAAMAFRPEAFKAGVNIFGVSNWLRTLESIPPYWESIRKALYEEIGDPVRDRDFLIATSPLFHAREIRKPLIVIQGANDPRVIKAESDDIVEAVKKNGVPVEYVVFPDEGHGFSKPKNNMEANRKIVEFLDKHLKN